jgi:hypothetical protein
LSNWSSPIFSSITFQNFPDTVIPWLTKIIRSGITFVSRNVSNFLLPLGLSLTFFGWWVSPVWCGQLISLSHTYRRKG